MEIIKKIQKKTLERICAFCGINFLIVNRKKLPINSYCCREHRIEHLKLYPPVKGFVRTEESNLKLSETRKKRIAEGLIIVPTGEQHQSWTGGKSKCIDCGKLLSGWISKRCSKCAKVGELSNNWNGGSFFRSIHDKIRQTKDYFNWRIKVFTRDNFTCTKCNKYSEGDIEAHHIKCLTIIVRENNLSDYHSITKCDELWDINNGITLCKKCHKDIHKENRRTQTWD